MSFEEQVRGVDVPSAVVESSDDVVDARRIYLRAITGYADGADLIIVVDCGNGLLAADILPYIEQSSNEMRSMRFCEVLSGSQSVTHRMTVQSSEPLATRCGASAATAQELTIAVCSSSFLVRTPLLGSQQATDLSAEQDTTHRSVGHSTCRTAPLCPLNTL